MSLKTFLYIARRASGIVLTLIVVSLMVFFVTAFLPGDAAQQSLGQFATPDQLEALRKEMGLGRPAVVRYFAWLYGLLQGDLGMSLASHAPITDLIGARLGSSATLAAVTAAISVPLALVIGITSAMFRGSALDRSLNAATMTTVAIPEFLIATLAVLIFAVKLQWVPALVFIQDIDSPLEFIRAYTLPVATLCCVITAQMARLTRAALVDQMSKPYIEMARLKGVGPVRVVLSHALPNTIGPIANAIAVSLSYLVGGAVIIETIFNYPGLAQLMVDGVANRDMPLIQACAMMFCSAYLLLLIIADVLGVITNPKLRSL